MKPHRLLFSPLRIGPLVARNRIVLSAHLTNLATEDGLPSPRHAAYYGARAAGGAGLVVTEESSIHPNDRAYEKLVQGHRPEVVPAYRAITEAVHAHDSLVFAQVNHNGPQASSIHSRLPLWGPSPEVDPHFREVPQEVGVGEIAELVAGYALVAGHCADGGFDGMELQCSQSSILRCFLSPATNRRSDAYGGSPERRARLLLEVVAAVREAIGPDRALGVRLCGDELVDGGGTVEEAVEVARMVEQQGMTDYLNTSIGVATASLHMVEPSMAVPPGYALFVPSALRKAVDLPVVGVGRFKDPAQAERALQEGHCDLVGVVRGQIADPDFASKAGSGHSGDVRLCLACNQECVARVGSNRWLGCVVNPSAGRERHRPIPVTAKGRGKGVVVVGAGPGGLQSAVAAAEAGHRVTLLEAADRPGGQVRLAASVPSRAEMGDLVRNLVRACERLEVAVLLCTTATAGTVAAMTPDAVVVATGSVPERPPWAPPIDGVVDLTQVLTGAVAPAGRVVVVDEIGFHNATSVAELLAERRCEVTVTTRLMVVGQDLDGTLDLEHWNHAAVAKGIRQLTDLVPTGVARSGHQLSLSLLHHPTGRPVEIHCDWVVTAVPPAPADQLYFDLRRAAPGLRVERVGDCVAPRRAHAAILEGQRVGASL